jgi:hypothetical protein
VRADEPDDVQDVARNEFALLNGEFHRRREDLLPLAQTAWAADWNTPEEDEAWRDL